MSCIEWNQNGCFICKVSNEKLECNGDIVFTAMY